MFDTSEQDHDTCNMSRCGLRMSGSYDLVAARQGNQSVGLFLWERQVARADAF
jgi:hypothetical protein